MEHAMQMGLDRSSQPSTNDRVIGQSSTNDLNEYLCLHGKCYFSDVHSYLRALKTQTTRSRVWLISYLFLRVLLISVKRQVWLEWEREEAPSDVNIMLDGSTYPRWKMCCFSQFHFFLQIKTQQAISRTSAATYKVLEPHWLQLGLNPKLLGHDANVLTTHHPSSS